MVDPKINHQIVIVFFYHFFLVKIYIIVLIPIGFESVHFYIKHYIAEVKI